MLKRPFNFLLKNWETLVLAFLLSVAVWVSAVVASDPNEENQFPNQIPIEVIGLGEDLEIYGNLPSTVTINLRAPQSLWDELLLNPDLITARLDLTNLEKGERLVPVEINFGIAPVELTKIDPELITVILEMEVSKQVELKIEPIGDLALGYEIEEITSDTEIVTVTGPETLVSQIIEIIGRITIGSAREDVSDRLRLIAVDENGRQISGANLMPSEVSTTVKVVQAGGYREVVVKVETIGTLPSGYRLTNISVFPPTITVFSSNPQAVAEMPGFVSTEPIDLREATDDIEVRLPLDLPEEVVMVGEEQSVEVQVGIAAIETTIALSRPIEILELGSGLTATLSPETVEIFLTGPLSVLETLDPEDVIVFISLSELGPGTHLAETLAEVLSDKVVIESINPDTIEVIITESDSETEQTITPESTPTPATTPPAIP
jgi:YbbR domain-containing protein